MVPQKATLIIGIRRCGKSTWQHEKMASLLEKGVDAKNICYIDFSDDRLDLLRLEGSDPAVIEDNCYGMYPQKHEQMVYFFFDEVLFVNRWAQFVNRIQTTNCARCISPVLQQNCFQRRLQLSWGGRPFTWEMFPIIMTKPKTHTGEERGAGMRSASLDALSDAGTLIFALCLGQCRLERQYQFTGLT